MIMKLKDILKEIEYIAVTGNTDIEITGVTNNSKAVEKGSLFVCIKGFKTDGHEYIEDAKKRGAAAIIVTEDIVCCDVTAVRAADGRSALAAASCAFYGHPSKKLNIIGVTGTNGKTTATYFIKSILDMSGKKTALIGTNNIIIGDEIIPSENTTPESCVLQMWFDMMVKRGIEYCVMEVSSHAADLKRINGIDFDTGVFTNLTRDHLDLHGTMENYMLAKLKFLNMCKKVIINVDDEYGRKMTKLTKCKNVVSYAADTNADYKAENISLSERGVIYDINCCGRMTKIKAVIPGRFNVYNTLAAAAVLFEDGFGEAQVQRGIIISKGAKGRAEVLQVPAPYKVMIDFAHTEDGLYNILTTLKEFVKGRIITVFGAAGDRDKEKRPDMGKTAGKFSDYCIITSDNPAGEKAADIISAVETGVKESLCPYECIEDRKTAIIKALDIAKEGDIVLLAGKGHETYQIIGSEKRPFSEENIVREYFDNK